MGAVIVYVVINVVTYVLWSLLSDILIVQVVGFEPWVCVANYNFHVFASS